MEELKKEIRKQWGCGTFVAMERITCPDHMAYWIADNIPLFNHAKLYILQLNSTIQRLRYELHLISKVTPSCFILMSFWTSPSVTNYGSGLLITVAIAITVANTVAIAVEITVAIPVAITVEIAVKISSNCSRN